MLDEFRHDRDRVFQIIKGSPVVEPGSLKERLLVEFSDDHRRRARAGDHRCPVQILGNRKAGEIVQHLGLVHDDDCRIAFGHEDTQPHKTFFIFFLRKKHYSVSQISRMASR